MNLVLRNEKLTIDEIRTGKSFKNIFADHESQVINIVKKWYSDEDNMEFVTSGSTGVSKVIRISKSKMRYSAEETMRHIDPQQEINHAILCIPSTFIGGAMLVIRSLVRNIDLIVQKPHAVPTLTSEPGLISMVPLQVMKSLESNEAYFKDQHTLLIGGAQLPNRYVDQLKTKRVNTYLTYGMTETASHIALRNIKSSDAYEVIGDTSIDIDDRDCLKIKGTLTDHQWIQTNDIVQLIDKKSFEWVGRADFVINTGGYKVNPESVENVLQEKIKKPILICSEADEILGHKVILLVESDEPFEIDKSVFDPLHTYSKPKKTVFVKSFVYTPSGKIDRIKTSIKHLQ